MPEGWAQQDSQASQNYFVDPNGERGMYVHAVELAEPMDTAQELARYVQQLTLEGFTDQSDAAREVVETRSEPDVEFVRLAFGSAAPSSKLSHALDGACGSIKRAPSDHLISDDLKLGSRAELLAP